MSDSPSGHVMLSQAMRRLAEGDDGTVLALLCDPALFERVRSAARSLDQPAAAYVREAIGRFLHTSSEEEWNDVLGHMQNDPAPGDRLIALATDRQLRRDGI